MPTKKLVGAAAIAAGVTIGSIAGALVGAPVTSSAQESAPSDDGMTDNRPPDGHRPRLANLDVAADAIGVTVEDLRAALEEGQSIADVATANEVDPQTVIDALVADAITRIDERVAAGELDASRAEELKAELGEHITDLVHREGGFGPGRPGGGHHGPGPDLAVAAEAIGVTVEDLRAALEEGQSIADVATANEVDPQTVIDALVAEATTRITDLVNRAGR